MAAHDLSAWLDEENQKARPYAVTGGRTRPRHTLRAVSLLVSARPEPADLAPEARQAVDLCRAEQRSVAEIAGRLHLPIQVTKVLLSDLLDSGALAMRVSDVSFSASHTTLASPDQVQLLEGVLVGLRRMWPDVA